MLIYEVLAVDHLKLKVLIFELIDAGDRGETRRSKLLVDEIHDELISHARAEEATLYMRLSENKETEPLVIFNGVQSHIQAEVLIGSLRTRLEIDSEWKVIARKLHQLVEVHIEHEEAEIFSAARTILSDDEAQSLTSSFQRFKPISRMSNWIESALHRVAHVLDPHRAARLRSLALKSMKLSLSRRSSARSH